MAWQMQPQMQQHMPQMQAMQQPMQHQQVQPQHHQQHQQMQPRQQMQHQQMQPQQMQQPQMQQPQMQQHQMQHQQMQQPQMQNQQMQAKGGKGGKGMRPVQNQVRPQGPSTPVPPGSQTIMVSGCSNETVSNIIKGTFSVAGHNHGKPTYKKDASNVTVLIYYWDDRDGPSFSGWWIGPQVGGDQVWSHADNRTSPTPPPAGWHVPWDGAVDPTLTLTYSTPATARTGGNAAPLGSKGGKGPAKGPPKGQPAGKGQVVGARPPKPVDVEANRQELERKKQNEAGQTGPGAQNKMEELRRKSAEAEEVQRKRQESMKRYREEEHQRRKETTAATNVRKVLAKVRAARPENYDALRIELESSISANLEAMGSTALKVGQEAEEVLLATQSRIDELNEQRAQEEKRRVEEEKQRRHEVENSAQFIEEAKSDAQSQMTKLQEVEEICQRLEDETDPTKLLESTEAAEKKIASVREEATDVKQGILEKQRSIDGMVGSKIRRELSEVLGKLSAGLRSLENTLRSVRSRREKVAGKAAAMQKINEKKLAFAKFDLDQDGKLNKKEVEAYMMATINYSLPPVILDQIVTKLDPITFVKFRSLHQRLYIAKSEILQAEARAVEEAKLREFEEKKQGLMQVLLAAEEELQPGEQAASEADRNFRPLLHQADASCDDLDHGIAQLEALTTSISKAVSSGQSKIEEAQGLQTGDLQTCLTAERRRVGHREKQLQLRRQQLEELLKALREKAKRRLVSEMDQKRSAVVLALRQRTEENTLELFEKINGGGGISRDQFRELLGDCGLDETERDKLFSFVVGDSSSMAKETFLEMMKLYYTCIKATLMSEELSIKSKTVRRIELGEVLEALESPQNEELAKVVRLRCRAKDGSVGWVTFKGNQGSPFLEPGGLRNEPTKTADGSGTTSVEGEPVDVHNGR